MRKLVTSDVFKMARIIRKAHIKEALADILKKTQDIEMNTLVDGEDAKRTLEKKQEAAGIDAVMTVFEACSTEELEKMLYEFFGGITEKGADGVANQTLETTVDDIKKIVAENNIFSFFKKASQLTK